MPVIERSEGSGVHTPSDVAPNRTIAINISNSVTPMNPAPDNDHPSNVTAITTTTSKDWNYAFAPQSKNVHPNFNHSTSLGSHAHVNGHGQNSGELHISFKETTLPVIVRLKWLMLNRLEKPISNIDLSDIHTLGVARNIMTIRCDCDLDSFMDICLVTALKHGLTLTLTLPSVSTASRVLFFPDYHRSQSGSQGTDSMAISFSTLVDLTDILGLRDEEDYEQILLKERTGTEIHYMQIIGSMEVKSSADLVNSTK